MNESGPRILIVEDDEAIATGLALNARLEGYLPEVVHEGDAAFTRIMEAPPDLIVLDISLPQRDGLSILKEIRERGVITPVVVLSAREGEYDKVAALRLGADDYVTKPFALAELMARLHAVLRRFSLGAVDHQALGVADRKPVQAPAFCFGEVAINLSTRTVTKGGQRVRLTHLEFELLKFLIDHPQRVLSREELLQQVWGVQHRGSKRTVDNFIAQLRAKLEDDPEEPRFLITVRGSGYRFMPG
ncbi:MAG: response regulator transcription factor [Myxococcota bacterium]